MATFLLDRPLPGLAKHLQLALAPHERNIEPASETGRDWIDANQPER
jgi:hypothetical protein